MVVTEPDEGDSVSNRINFSNLAAFMKTISSVSYLRVEKIGGENLLMISQLRFIFFSHKLH